MDEISLVDITLFIKKHFYNFIKIFLPLSIIFVCVVYLLNQNKSSSLYYTFSISLSGDYGPISLSEDYRPKSQDLYLLPDSFWFDKNFFLDAFSESNIEIDEEYIDKDFLSKFTMVSGLSTLNDIIADATDEKKFDQFYKNVAINSEKLNEVLNNMFLVNQNYKTVYVEADNLSLTKDELSIFIQNWVNVINESFLKNKRGTVVSLIQLPDISKDLDTRELIMINKVMEIISENLAVMKSTYSQYTNENIDIIMIRFFGIKEAVHALISQNSEAKEYIVAEYELQIKHLNNKMDQVNSIIDGKEKNLLKDSNAENIEQLNLSGSTIESLIDLGNAIALNDTNNEYQKMLFNLEDKKFFYQNELSKIMNASVFLSDSDNGNAQIVNDLFSIVADMNDIVSSVNNLKTTTKPIMLLSSPIISDLDTYDQMKKNMLISIFIAFLISLSSLVLLNVKRDNN